MCVNDNSFFTTRVDLSMYFSLWFSDVYNSLPLFCALVPFVLIRICITVPGQLDLNLDSDVNAQSTQT